MGQPRETLQHAAQVRKMESSIIYVMTGPEVFFSFLYLKISIYIRGETLPLNEYNFPLFFFFFFFLNQGQ